jgi:hypothetical protein
MFTRDNLKIINVMVKELCSSAMEINIKVSGKMAILMEMENFIVKQKMPYIGEISLKEFSHYQIRKYSLIKRKID